MRPINISFGATAYGPLWPPAASSWLRVVAFTARKYAIEHVGQIGGAGVTDRTYTMTAENEIVKQSLANPDFTHIFMTEMDMILPHDTITKLVALDKDMASGLYFLRADLQAGRGQPCLYKKPPLREATEQAKRSFNPYFHTPVTLFNKGAPFQVDCAGLGCILFKREVFEELEYPWFDLKAGTDVKIGYGSDMYFSHHARSAGFELWCDPSVRCKQIDYYETDIEDYEWQLENNPSFAAAGFIIGQGEMNGTADAKRGSGHDAAPTQSDK